MSALVKLVPSRFQEVPPEKALNAFLLDCRAKNLSEETVIWYKRRVEWFLGFLNSVEVSPTLVSVTEENVKLFIQHHKERAHQRKKDAKLSSQTVQGTVRGIKVFLKFLHEEGYIAENVTARIKLPKAQKKIIQTLSSEQIEKLLTIPNRKKFTGFRNYCILLTFLDTGIRVSELANLKTGDIDFSRNTLKVLGKGNKERIVTFGISLRKVLEKYVSWRGDIPGQTFLFVSHYGERIGRRSVEQIFQTYREKMDVTGVRLSPHTLRHTFAKMSLLNGLDALTLQYILGHTSLEMVRHYVNLTSQEVALNKNRISLIDRMEIRGTKTRTKLF